jgi:predicted metal-dependent HD superfamily phosphohydrolase
MPINAASAESNTDSVHFTANDHGAVTFSGANAANRVRHSMKQTSKMNQSRVNSARFCALWNRSRAFARGADASNIWGYLIDQFSEPHRHYHDQTHIAHCLAELDGARNRIGNPDAVELALWFHDAIYEPGARDNEARSAALFLNYAKDALAEPLAREVHDAILATVHRKVPDRGNARFVVDIDLSSFGLPWPRFMADCHALRREQIDIADGEFYRNKCKFLHSLVDRSSIFVTPYFRQRYEDTARTNIQRYLELVEHR